MNLKEAITFAKWDTPFKDDDVEIFDLQYGNGGLETIFHDKNQKLSLPRKRNLDFHDLEIKIVSYQSNTIYSILYENISAFRLLDEHGLCDLWNALEKRPSKTTFRVRNHGWCEESPLSFFMSGNEYSFIIATDWECLEVICPSEPKIIDKGCIPYETHTNT